MIIPCLVKKSNHRFWKLQCASWREIGSKGKDVMEPFWSGYIDEEMSSRCCSSGSESVQKLVVGLLLRIGQV
jgi:hypothetical protein